MPDDTQEPKEETIDPEVAESNKLADTLTSIAVKQLGVGIKFRQPRLDDILKAEELYFNRKTKTLKGRFNIPLPIMSGFVDTLVAKIDDEITINYDHTEEADKIKARKVQAAWRFDSAPTRGMWAIKDILVKKLAIFSGRGIYKAFAESDPYYQFCFDIVDAFDFIAEPNGGWHLENHLFCGQENIFKTKKQLEEGVASELYNAENVKSILLSTSDEKLQINRDLFQNRAKRLQGFGLDATSNNYVGQDIYALVEWNMAWNGKRYYILFEPVTGLWVRFAPLEEITGTPEKGCQPRYVWKSWATHYDAWNFWSKAPVDDIRPIAEGMKVITNFMFDDVQKKLWGQRIFDAEIIVDPAQLEWDRPDKLIQAVLPAGKKLSDGVYEFQTNDNSSMVISLVDYFRGFIGTESGVTPQTKGESDEKILGIAKINEGEVADRLGLYNKFYVQCYAELGLAYLSGLKEHMDEKLLIRMIGEAGAESAELTKEDLNFTSAPDVRITGGKSEARKNEALQEKKIVALTGAIAIAPELFSKKVVSESILQNGGWDPDEITSLMDVSSDGNEEESIRASQAIQDLLVDKKIDIYNGATTRFVEKILRFASAKVLKPDQKIRLMNYAQAHQPIIMKNMAMKAQREITQAQLANPAGAPPIEASDKIVPAPLPAQQ